MFVRLVCQCGNEIKLSEDLSVAEVRCAQCGRIVRTSSMSQKDSSSDADATRQMNSAGTNSSDDTASFTPAVPSPVQPTEPLSTEPRSEANDAKPADTETILEEATSADVGFDDQVTRISSDRTGSTEVYPEPKVQDPIEIDTSAPNFGRDPHGSGDTRFFNVDDDVTKISARTPDDDFELVAPEDDETKIASGVEMPSSPSSRSAQMRSGSHITNLNLADRVMNPINRPTTPVNLAHNTGDYGIHQILRTHQKGGMGRILIAYDQHLKRDIALKELHRNVAEDMSIVRRFIGEAEITAQLEHPGIVPIHMLDLDKSGYPYYTMKLIKGVTYQEAIKDYHRNPTKAELFHLIRRLVSICKTIAFAHSKGVIHRDLKPANIMLGEHGETLVMDWGLAKPFNLNKSDETAFTSVAVQHLAEEQRPDLTMVGAVVGTPAFMSPEQASPEDHEVGPLADIFSLGTILYYLLAGQTAFSGRSTREVLAKVRTAAPPPPSEIKANVPPGLEAICAKAMAKQPEDRYQNAMQMVDDLCRWLDGEPISAQKETFSQKVYRWMGRYRLMTISIPFVLVLFIILMNLGIYIDRRNRDLAHDKIVQTVLNDPVDLTDQPGVVFRASSGVDVTREERMTGGDMIICQIETPPESRQGMIEIVAPERRAWDLARRNCMQLSIFEPKNTDSSNDPPLESFTLRIGRGSSYFEYKPEMQWWANRRLGHWFTFTIPLNGSGIWKKTVSGDPKLEEIEWVEIHFRLEKPTSFHIDNIIFQTPEK